jgi:heat shock protein HslJ
MMYAVAGICTFFHNSHPADSAALAAEIAVAVAAPVVNVPIEPHLSIKRENAFMDRFQRYAIIIGPIIGAILVYLIFTSMADQLRSDQETLGELGAVTLQEVAQNPAMLTGEEGEGAEAEGETAAEEGVIEAETIVTDTVAVDAGEGVTATEAVTIETVTTDTAAVDATEAVTAAETVDADTALTDTASAEASGAVTVTEEAAADDAAVEAETVVTDTAAAEAGVTVTEAQAAVEDSTVVTGTEEVVIAATTTDTASVVGGAIVAENVVWLLLQYEDSSGALVDVLEDSAITALFNAGAISGSTGCSNYAGRYTADEEGAFTVTLTAISPAGAELEACVDGGDLNIQEADYLAALARSATFTADDGGFDVSDADGNVILHYELEESGG